MSGTTTVALTGDQNIDGVLAGVRWTNATISFAYTDAAAQYGGGTAYDTTYDPDDGGPLPSVTFNEASALQSLGGSQRSAAGAVFGAVEQFTNLGFTWETANPGAADLRLAMTTAPDPRRDLDPATGGVQWTAYAYYPDAAKGGDVWFNTTSYNTPVLGTYAYQTFFHEIGHLLGLKHGHEAEHGNATVLAANRNSLEFSTMTYASYVGAPTGSYSVIDGHYPQSFMMYDIAALQVMYGADYSDISSNVYAFDPDTGVAYRDGIALGDGAQSPGLSPVNVLFRTIWDGGGYDTYDFSAYDATRDLAIDLAPGGWTDVDRDSDFQAANLGAGHFARGQVFNALLFNGDLRSLIEAAIGGAGNDSIDGNQADNVLEGRLGNDTLRGLGGRDVLDQGGGGGMMEGFSGNDTMIAGDGAELIIGDGGNDRVDYSRSTDRVVIDTTLGIAAFGFATGDALFTVEELIGSNFGDTLIMGDGRNTIQGLDGADTLAGGAADDRLVGGRGEDELKGGTGADYISGGNGFDTAAFDTAVSIDLASGIYTGEAAGDRFLSIEAFRGSGASDTMWAGAAAMLFSGEGDSDSLFGGAGADTLRGGEGTDSLDGLGSGDVLEGDAGNDTLRGGAGADTLHGGADFDQASYIGASAAVTVHLVTGGTGGDALGDVYESIEAVYGTRFADSITGDGSDNLLRGYGGNDTLEGGDGADSLQGGNGDDILLVDGSDEILGGDGYDDVRAVSETIANGFRLTATVAMSVEAIYGNNGHDLIDATAMTASVYLVGHNGNDTLICGAGDDAVIAGEGNDSILGGAGFDQLHGNGGNDTIVGGGGPANPPWGDWLFGYEGDDVLVGSGFGQVIGYEGNDTLTGGVGDYMAGNEGHDSLTGGAGLQQMLGSAGNDTMTGGADGDRFDVEDGWGDDRITDFEIGLDQIGMFAVTGLDSFAQLTLTNVAEGVRIAFAGNSILLVGRTSSALQETDFLL